jgi:hypothetical protein
MDSRFRGSGTIFGFLRDHQIQMTYFLCEYKYFFNGVKRLRSATTRVTGWMQCLGFILNRIAIIQKFQRIIPGQATGRCASASRNSGKLFDL